MCNPISSSRVNNEHSALTVISKVLSIQTHVHRVLGYTLVLLYTMHMKCELFRS